jgi:hypothetical protein
MKSLSLCMLDKCSTTELYFQSKYSVSKILSPSNSSCNYTYLKNDKLTLSVAQEKKKQNILTHFFLQVVFK